MAEADQAKMSKAQKSREELKKLKLAKKEAKKKQNAQQQPEQELPPKVLERVFVPVPDQKPMLNKLGDLRIMTFNVTYISQCQAYNNLAFYN